MGEINEELAVQTFEKIFKNYRKVDPNDNLDRILERQLPKICVNDISKAIIDKVSEILSAEISLKNKSLSIEDLHTLTYCGARTVTELCKHLVYEQSQIPTKFPEDETEQRRLFQNSPQKFGRLLFEDSTDEAVAPSEESIKLWEEASHYKKDEALVYIQNEKKRVEEQITTDLITDSEIRMADLKKALKKKKNWSPPGIDGVQTFWYKKFKPVTRVLLRKINDILKGGEEMPEFFTVGFTELHSKGKSKGNPEKPSTELHSKEGNPEKASNYRPITHLPAIYKIITRCIYQKILNHYEDYNILADEQCGGRKDCYGVRKTLIIDSVALNQEKVHGCYVDFEKAFDSVPHDWILEMLRIYKVDEDIIQFLEKTMSKWWTRIYLKPHTLTRPIQLKKGVFQGDSISVILFWTAINPLSFALRNTNAGLNLEQGGILSHVLYMDNLKLYASNYENLKTNNNEVEKFAKAINMATNKNKNYEFSIPRSVNKKIEDVVYLGYIQKPKIENNETIYHKVRKFDGKCKKISSETKISEEDKIILKKKFVYNAIFNTFGVLHWRLFKRELLKTEVRKKFLPIVREQDKDLSTIYLKLIDDMCRMRRKFIKEGQASEFMNNIIRNDTATPLRLSLVDEKEYVKAIAAQIKERRQRKRKVPNGP